MSDTASRNSNAAAQRLADALLRTVAGASAMFRVTLADGGSANDQSELGLVATSFAQVVVSPVVMRKLRPDWRDSDDTRARWELLVSATGVASQVNALEMQSAAALLAATMAVTVAGQDYLIETVAANEAMGQVYLYRLLLREAGVGAV